MYVMLSGNLPFSGKHAADVFDKVKHAEYNFKDAVWEDVSEEAKDLISKLLVLNPSKRLTPA